MVSEDASIPPRRNTAGRSSIRTKPRRTRVCRVDEGRSLRRSSASGSSPPQAANSARMACCFWVSAGKRASGTSTAKRSVRRASRSVAEVSRAIHFLRSMEARTGSVAAVAVRSVETLTGSPEARRVRTRCSRSCSSWDNFPRRFLISFCVHPFPESPSRLTASTSRPRSVMR